MQDATAPASSKRPTLQGVEIPADFVFETKRPVSLRVEATREALAGNAHARVLVERPDGALLYRGPLRAGEPLSVNVSLPNKDTTLQVKLQAGDHERVSSVSVNGGAAVSAFE